MNTANPKTYSSAILSSFMKQTSFLLSFLRTGSVRPPDESYNRREPRLRYGGWGIAIYGCPSVHGRQNQSSRSNSERYRGLSSVRPIAFASETISACHRGDTRVPPSNTRVALSTIYPFFIVHVSYGASTGDDDDADDDDSL